MPPPKQAVMPVTVLGLYQAASYTRYVRSAVLDVIKLDYRGAIHEVLQHAYCDLRLQWHLAQ